MVGKELPELGSDSLKSGLFLFELLGFGVRYVLKRRRREGKALEINPAFRNLTNVEKFTFV